MADVYETVGKSVISVCKKGPKELADAFYGFERDCFCDLF